MSCGLRRIVSCQRCSLYPSEYGIQCIISQNTCIDNIEADEDLRVAECLSYAEDLIERTKKRAHGTPLFRVHS